MDATLTIAAGSAVNTEVCGSVMVIGDLIREPNEMFTVRLTPRNSNDEISTVVEFRVTIQDDNDSEFSSSQQSPDHADLTAWILTILIHPLHVVTSLYYLPPALLISKRETLFQQCNIIVSLDLVQSGPGICIQHFSCWMGKCSWSACCAKTASSVYLSSGM